jgi:hypothetical protein
MSVDVTLSTPPGPYLWTGPLPADFCAHEDTPLGHYQDVTDLVQMSKTPGYCEPLLVPLGSCYPEQR